MSTSVSSTPAPAATGPGWFIQDMMVMASRSLKRLIRQRDQLGQALLQPIMFYFLFLIVFGGGMQVPGGNYNQFVMPGVLTQHVVFGSVAAMSAGLSAEMRNGVMDRFKSLPTSAAAGLFGRTLVEIVRNVMGFVTVLAIAMLLGYRFGGTIGQILLGFGLLLLLGFAMSWLLALLGLVAPSAETAQFIGFMGLFPFAFLSSAFTPSHMLPSWLHWWAENQPVTATIDAARALFDGSDATGLILPAVLWPIGIIVVCLPLAVARISKVE